MSDQGRLRYAFGLRDNAWVVNYVTCMPVNEPELDDYILDFAFRARHRAGPYKMYRGSDRRSGSLILYWYYVR